MTSTLTRYLLNHRQVFVRDGYAWFSGDWETDLTFAARYALAQLDLPWRGLADTADFIAEGMAESDLDYGMSSSYMAERIYEQAATMTLEAANTLALEVLHKPLHALADKRIDR